MIEKEDAIKKILTTIVNKNASINPKLIKNGVPIGVIAGPSNNLIEGFCQLVSKESGDKLVDWEFTVGRARIECLPEDYEIVYKTANKLFPYFNEAYRRFQQKEKRLKDWIFDIQTNGCFI
jgi:hypothetical protein